MVRARLLYQLGGGVGLLGWRGLLQQRWRAIASLRAGPHRGLRLLVGVWRRVRLPVGLWRRVRLPVWLWRRVRLPLGLWRRVRQSLSWLPSGTAGWLLCGGCWFLAREGATAVGALTDSGVQPKWLRSARRPVEVELREAAVVSEDGCWWLGCGWVVGGEGLRGWWLRWGQCSRWRSRSPR